MMDHGSTMYRHDPLVVKRNRSQPSCAPLLKEELSDDEGVGRRHGAVGSSEDELNVQSAGDADGDADIGGFVIAYWRYEILRVSPR